MIPRSHHLNDDDLLAMYGSVPVVIAVLDTGVDPNARGLQVTSSGLPKILDLVDCSGAGDTIMTPVVINVDTRMVVGKTGRSLTIPNEWLDRIVTDEHQEKKIRIGIVEAYSLFPRPLVKKHRSKRQEKFMERNRTVESELHAELSRAKASKNEEHIADLEVRLKELAAMSEKFSSLDYGSVYDIVMFQDERGFWMIAIDTSEAGQLDSAKLMGEYRFQQEFSTFGTELLSYSFNVYDDGDILSVVTVAGSHGTHVAGIAAAHFPDDTQLDGINPNAQIISMKIGDTRMGSMETCTALMRAFTACINAKVDVINMSYGEATSIPNQGRICQMIRDVVNKHNIIFVASAGNSGPAHHTVGAPGGTTDAAISVGAFVTSEMAQQLYSVCCDLPPQQTTWSSRGPSADGGRGVTISAPGAAIAPVPTWTLNNKQLMNGTSMSSPNAAGAISNLIAFTRQQGIGLSVSRIRRAIESTAVPVEGISPLTIGHGLLSSRLAAAYLVQHRDDPRQDVRFEVSVGNGNRGIILREPHQIQTTSAHSVKVVPFLPDDEDNVAKSKLELNLSLKCEDPWISCPAALFVCNEGRSFSVHIDPTSLSANQVYFSEIVAFIDDSSSNGPIVMFSVPITVFVAAKCDGAVTLEFNKLAFEPGTIYRQFLSVPRGAVSAGIAIQSHGNEDGRRFVLHTLYNETGRSHRETSTHKYLTIQGTRRHFFFISVKEMTTLEVAIAQFWSVPGLTEASLRIDWCGLSLRPSSLHFSFVDRILRADVHSLLKTEGVQASANVSSWILPLMPTSEGVIRGLSRRDTWPSQRHTYELILSYKFNNVVSCPVTAEYRILNNQLYESDFDSQMCQIFDSHKKRVHLSDAFPKPVTLEKGDYTVRIQIRHDNRQALVALQHMPINIVRKLSKHIDMEIYHNFNSAVLRQKSPKKTENILHLFESATYFMTLPASMSLPKGINSSCSLRGTVVLTTSNCPDAPTMKYPLTCSGCLESGKDKPESLSQEDETTPESALRDCIVRWIDKQTGSYAEKYCGAGFDLLLKEPNPHQSVLVSQLKHLVAQSKSVSDSEKLGLAAKILETSNSLLDGIDQAKLATDCGMRPPSGSKSAPFTKKIKEQKKVLVLALICRATWADDPNIMEETMTTLQQWVDIKDVDAHPELLLLGVKYYLRHDRLGQCLKLLNENDRQCRDKELQEYRRLVLDKLGWDHWASIMENRHLLANPSDFAPF